MIAKNRSKRLRLVQKILKLSLLFVFFLIISCGREESKINVVRGDAFGTTYTIQFFSEKDLDTEKGIDSVIYAINKSVSTYMPNSDISRINRGDTTVVVDAIFKEVYRISEAVYTNSHGYFDPTIGVLRNAYGFGDTKPIANIDSKVVDSLMEFVGFRKVSVSNDGKVRKAHPQIYFDFNAVAKGYGIDCLGRYLEKEGVTHYLIELGGEILAKGKNMGKQTSWVVGIENASSDLENRSFKTTVKLEDKGMASSGNYRKFRVDSVSGKKSVHTINPLTGSAEQSDVTSATVIANSCGVADAYATALMALGFEKSKELLNSTAGIEAYLTYTDGSNNEQIYTTDGFRKLIVD
jgi:thiamine biosynthesis lipoprotein